MGEFLYHTNCDECNSSDAKAVYLGGSTFCFSCKAYKRGSVFSPIDKPKKLTKSLPDDLSYEYFPAAVEWFNKYGLSIEDIRRQNIQSSKSTQSVYFCWYATEDSLGEEKSKTPIAWQRRNFSDYGPKYSSSGELGTVFPIYSGDLRRDRALLIVEDCLSAIKALKTGLVDTMPCLTSGLPISKLKVLAGLYSRFTVWLDGDMFKNAQEMAYQLQLFDCDAKAVWTKEDPKCYNVQQIESVLLTGKLS